jgi:hypothetical protein
MKTRNFETSVEILKGFALTNEEMITVRGGDEGSPDPVTPPVKI